MLKRPLKCSRHHSAWDLMIRRIPLPQRSLNSSILLLARTLRDKERVTSQLWAGTAPLYNRYMVVLTYQNGDDLWLTAGTFAWCLHSSIRPCLITGALFHFLFQVYSKEERETQSVTLLVYRVAHAFNPSTAEAETDSVWEFLPHSTSKKTRV